MKPGANGQRLFKEVSAKRRADRLRLYKDLGGNCRHLSRKVAGPRRRPAAALDLAIQFKVTAYFLISNVLTRYFSDPACPQCRTARSVVSNSPLPIALRELITVSQTLKWDPQALKAEQIQNAKDRAMF